MPRPKIGVPIFVDERGRRARLWWFAAVVVGFVGVAYLALAGISLLGGSSFSGLPWPSQTHRADARAGSRPGPDPAAPSVASVQGRTGQHPLAQVATTTTPPTGAAQAEPGAQAVTPAIPVSASAAPTTAAPIVSSVPSHPSSPPLTTAGAAAPGRTTSATAQTTQATAPGQTTKTTTPAQTTKTTAPGQTTKTTAPGRSVGGSSPGSTR